MPFKPHRPLNVALTSAYLAAVYTHLRFTCLRCDRHLRGKMWKNPEFPIFNNGWRNCIRLVFVFNQILMGLLGKNYLHSFGCVGRWFGDVVDACKNAEQANCLKNIQPLREKSIWVGSSSWKTKRWEASHQVGWRCIQEVRPIVLF